VYYFVTQSHLAHRKCFTCKRCHVFKIQQRVVQ
jgi:hypothetical protein